MGGAGGEVLPPPEAPQGAGHHAHGGAVPPRSTPAGAAMTSSGCDALRPLPAPLTRYPDPMPDSLAIAQSARLRPISAVAEEAGLLRAEVEPYGAHVGKVTAGAAVQRLAGRPRGKLVLVTAITPTSRGEGKTTTAIGLVDALRRLGVRAMATLRQPSLGPVFGLKGGASGGGRAQVVPMETLNLHLTGDFHAVTA